MGFVFVFVFVLIFIGISIASKIMTKDPIEENFSGVISDYGRLYPSLIRFTFENQDETYYMSTNLEEFKKSLSIGDSVVKPMNDPYIYIYKKEKEKYILYKWFMYE